VRTDGLARVIDREGVCQCVHVSELNGEEECMVAQQVFSKLSSVFKILRHCLLTMHRLRLTSIAPAVSLHLPLHLCAAHQISVGHNASLTPRRLITFLSSISRVAHMPRSQPSMNPQSKTDGNPLQAIPTKRHLLTLPPELRNRIWCFALVKDTPVQATRAVTYETSGNIIDDKFYIPHSQFPHLTHTCHQIRAESRAIYFEENTICLTGNVLYAGFTNSLFRLCGASTKRISKLEVRENFQARLFGGAQPYACSAHYVISADAGRITIEEKELVIRSLTAGQQNREACGCRLQRVGVDWNRNVQVYGRNGMFDDPAFAFLAFLVSMNGMNREEQKGDRIEPALLWWCEECGRMNV